MFWLIVSTLIATIGVYWFFKKGKKKLPKREEFESLADEEIEKKYSKKVLESLKRTLFNSEGLAEDFALRTRKDVWEQFKTTFVAEFANFEEFDEYLCHEEEPKTLLLFHDYRSNLQGFLILHNYRNKMIEGKPVNIVVGNFFLVKAAFRGSKKPIAELLKYTVRQKLKSPFQETYYFFITYSFKSYLSFSRSMGEFYPCKEKSTPTRIAAIINTLGEEMAGDWGDYNPDTCVIKDKFKGGKGRLSMLDRSSPKDLSNTIIWFLNRNPGYRIGDCLCVICPVSLYNMMVGASRSIFTFGKRRRSKHRKRYKQDTAFGLAENRADYENRMNTETQPFKIEVPERQLDDLYDRLEDARLPEAIGEASGNQDSLGDWKQGTNKHFMKEIIDYWIDEYDWRTVEQELNELPQYTIEIKEQTIHFLHIRAEVASAIPLVLIHGWPGSFYEFYKIIPLLTKPDEEGRCFHLIIPSLPGYGWSDKPTEPGVDISEVADLFVSLMAALKYNRYTVQGGDWGHLAAAHMAIKDPDRCMGIHLNMVAAWPPTTFVQKARMIFDSLPLVSGLRLDEPGRKWLEEIDDFMETDMAYIDVQGRTPQTLGFSLSDSPLGLAAWILEKYHSWTERGEKGEILLTKDELLTTVMIYWVTNSATSAARLYYESRQAGTFGPPKVRVAVPTAIAFFPKDVSRPPRRWINQYYNVKRWSYMKHGGHFAALEQPNALAEDIRKFFQVDLKLHTLFTAEEICTKSNERSIEERIKESEET